MLKIKVECNVVKVLENVKENKSVKKTFDWILIFLLW